VRPSGRRGAAATGSRLGFFRKNYESSHHVNGVNRAALLQGLGSSAPSQARYLEVRPQGTESAYAFQCSGSPQLVRCHWRCLVTFARTRQNVLAVARRIDYQQGAKSEHEGEGHEKVHVCWVGRSVVGGWLQR
jgi:hypothetical protein